MSFFTAPTRRVLSETLTAVVLSLVLLGCGNSSSESQSQSQENASRVARYTVRGRVQEMPRMGFPTSQFLVHHEPIPSYMSGGKVVGMKSMTMPFPLGENVSIDGYSVGEIIELTFEVQFDSEKDIPLGFEIIVLHKLPPETHLVFERRDSGEEAAADSRK